MTIIHRWALTVTAKPLFWQPEHLARRNILGICRMRNGNEIGIIEWKLVRIKSYSSWYEVTEEKEVTKILEKKK